jgi:hypothetical protein
MTEDMLNKYMMVGSMCLAGLSGLGTIALLVTTAVEYSFAVLMATVLLGCVTVGFGWAASVYGSKITGTDLVFTNPAEREILTPKQRKELRKARGEVVMERALVEVEHERQNITHRQIEAANDPEKPPHLTQWTNNGMDQKKVLGDRKDRL